MKYFGLILITLITQTVYSKKEKSKKLNIPYPTTIKTNHTDEYFGTIVEDPYQWLEDDTCKATTDWVSMQNKVTYSYLSNIPYREEIKKRYTELYDYAKLDNPIIVGNKLIFEKKEGTQNQAILYIQEIANGKPEIFINPNELDEKGLTTYSISGVSTDDKYIAISSHKSGSDWSEMYIYDVATKKRLDDKLEWLKSSAASWDKNGFYYSRYPKPEAGKELSSKNEYLSVYYHQLGTPQEQDILIYSDKNDPNSFNAAYVSEDGAYLYLYKFKGTYGNELYFKKISEPGWNFTPLFTSYKNSYTLINNIQDNFLILTDDNASNKQLILVDPKNNDIKQWKKIIAEKKDALIEDIGISNGKIIVKYLQNAACKLMTYDLNGKNEKEIALPGIGNIEIYYGKQNSTFFSYTYSSFNYPNSIFIHNLNNGYSSLFLKPDLKFNPEDYVSKQVWYKSKDGTKVSMFITHKKDIILNRKNPTYLYGYGGFNSNETPRFSASRILLLENGGVFALPNLRGGGEYGQAWHEAGMLMKKQNVFDDFIYAAQYLIKQKYTSKEKLAIAGGSNGGLLVGACMTQKPELFKVAFPAVGVMDMLKYQHFTVGHGWVVEYGSSEQSKEMFEYLYRYSPYHNIKKDIKYPATMITTADHDDRVVPAHSFKFAARLQEYGNKSVPLLIRIGINAGHGKGKPTSMIIEEVADQWSFFFWNVGVKSLIK